MRKYILAPLFVLFGFALYAQKSNKPALLYSLPISVTPLSLWESDISVSAGAEYRFHPSFSVRLAADYIYGDYGYERSATGGIRLRQELRYYIAGNKLISSRSKAWPYISASFGNKWVTTRFADWQYLYQNDQSYQKWQRYNTHNREWYLMGRTGMQTVFGKGKRFLFDFSIGVSFSRDKVSFSFPDGEDISSQVLPNYNSNNEFAEASRNKYSGKFTAFNIEACFGYRLAGKK
ncbi:MAG: hypothetical protein QM763_03040 [Agriterribacter sp.]